MLTPADYMAFLNRNGVKLWIDAGQLRYHARKGALSTEELARLRSMRSEIVAELTKTGPSAPDDPGQTQPTGDAPLSLQQRWLLKLLGEHPKWKGTLIHTFRLTGVLDCKALERSLASILDRHASLRTRMVRVAGEWGQKIETLDRFELPVVQVSGESDDEKQRSASLAIQNMGARELDPTAAPLMSARLLRLSRQEHFLVLLIHRLATDCLGIGQTIRDLWALYAQTVLEGPSKGSAGSAAYRDYALWQHTTDGAWQQKHGAYWNEYLASARCVSWPRNILRPVNGASAPATVDRSTEMVSLETSFGETLSAGLRELSRQTRTLLALVVLTVYVACVSMWCGQSEFVMPFVITGRAAAHEGVVGCFSHVIYLRLQLKGGESFTELLKLVNNEFYRAAAFRQDCGRVTTERPELLRGTLFQWLSWHPADIAGFHTDPALNQLGLEVEKVRCQSLEELSNVPPGRVDLEMNFFDSAGDICALALHEADRFAEGTLAHLMQDLRSVAEHVVRDPGARLRG
jgi:hypothetical protein